jgi:hypothetical protein
MALHHAAHEPAPSGQPPLLSDAQIVAITMGSGANWPVACWGCHR